MDMPCTRQDSLVLEDWNQMESLPTLPVGSTEKSTGVLIPQRAMLGTSHSPWWQPTSVMHSWMDVHWRHKSPQI